MATDEIVIERIFSDNQGYIDSIRDGIVKGVREGIHEGIESGTKRAAWDVLKQECRVQGITNISGVDIETIVEHISKLTVSKDITRTTRGIFRKTFNAYLEKISNDIIDEFRARLPVLSGITELIQQRKQEISSQIRGVLPDNPLCIGIADGIQKSVEDALNKGIQNFSDRLKKKINVEDIEQPTESRQSAGSGDVDKIRGEVKNRVKNAVAKVVDGIIYEIMIQITRRTVAGVKEKLKQALGEELEKLTREQLENRLTETIDLLKERCATKCTDKTHFISNLDKYLGNNIKKHVLHLASKIPIVAALAATAAVAAGGITYAVTSNQSPVAEARFEPVAPLTISCSSEGSYDPDGYVRYCLWEFGDGSVSRESNPTHEYGEPGRYIVVLTVTDDEGEESSTKMPVSIETPSIPPVAVADIDWQSGLAVRFVGEESHDPDGGAIVAWHWSFGDEHFSEESNPTHEYGEPGRYIVVLTVTDDEGEESSTKMPVSIEAIPAVLGVIPPTPTTNFFGPIAKSVDGAVYVAGRTGAANAIYRSDDFGDSWEELSNLPTTSTQQITDLVCSSIDPYVLYVTNGTDIWKTTNAGYTWSILPNVFSFLGLEPGLGDDGNITSIDIGYIEEDPYVFASTSTFGSGRGDVYMLEEAEYGMPWSSLNVDTDREWGKQWDEGAADVFKVVVPPDFQDTNMIIAIATNVKEGPATYITTRISSESWGESANDISLELDGIPIRQPVRADIWTPWDFELNGSDEYYASIASLDPAGGDVFRVLHSEYAEDLDIGIGTSTSITDIDGVGTTSVSSLLAGGDDGTGEPIVFRSTNSGMTWGVSPEPPSGDVWDRIVRVSLILHDEFDANGRALAATGGFDTSISYTEDGGMTWHHKPVIHSDLRIEFSEPMDTYATAEAIIIYPEIDYDIFWEDDDTLMTIHPLSTWEPGTTYELTVSKDARSREGEYLEEDYGFTFTTSS